MKGFGKAFHPRLCSLEFFEMFHTQNIRGLRKRQRSKSNTRSRPNYYSCSENIIDISQSAVSEGSDNISTGSDVREKLL